MNMDHFHGWALLAPFMSMATLHLLLCIGGVGAWLLHHKIHLPAHGGVRGTLLLQIEVNGVVVAHIGMITAEDRHSKKVYNWSISQLKADTFPYFAMTDLPFTHIIVRQEKGAENLVTVSVIERPSWLRFKDFYWIKNATIGSLPGFPRQLLLPHNFVLKYVDESGSFG